MNDVTNVVVSGLGGQGVVKASDILAEAAFRAGLDVKKSELHGMSQRGGSVTSDVRFGSTVWSPMVPRGEADFWVQLEAGAPGLAGIWLRPGGLVVAASGVDLRSLPGRRCLNVALLGALSVHLQRIPELAWQEALAACLPPGALEANRLAFATGRAAFGKGDAR